jgi:WD40 repeat protein
VLLQKGKPVRAIRISPDGRWVATGCEDKSVELRDIASGDVRSFVGHTKGVLGLAFSPDGRFLVSASDESMIVWDVASGARVHTLGGPRRGRDSVSFSLDGRTIAAGGDGGNISLWDLPSVDGITVE